MVTSGGALQMDIGATSGFVERVMRAQTHVEDAFSAIGRSGGDDADLLGLAGTELRSAIGELDLASGPGSTTTKRAWYFANDVVGRLRRIEGQLDPAGGDAAVSQAKASLRELSEIAYKDLPRTAGLATDDAEQLGFVDDTRMFTAETVARREPGPRALSSTAFEDASRLFDDMDDAAARAQRAVERERATRFDGYFLDVPPQDGPLQVPSSLRPASNGPKLDDLGRIPASDDAIALGMDLRDPRQAARALRTSANVPAYGSAPIADRAPDPGEVLARATYPTPHGFVSVELAAHRTAMFNDFDAAMRAAQNRDLWPRELEKLERLVTPRKSGGWDVTFARPRIGSLEIDAGPATADEIGRALRASPGGTGVVSQITERGRRVDGWVSRHGHLARTLRNGAEPAANARELELSVPMLGDRLGGYSITQGVFKRTRDHAVTVRTSELFVGSVDEVTQLAAAREGAHAVLHAGPDTYAVLGLDLAGDQVRRLARGALEEVPLTLDERVVAVTARTGRQHAVTPYVPASIHPLDSLDDLGPAPRGIDG